MISLLLALAAAAPEEDNVPSLPQCPGFRHAVYSGYLKVSETKKLHYVLTESDKDPSNDPLVIWFNGGPGCSSLLGMFMEIGPCVVDDGETEFHANPAPWNQELNMLYIEQPVDVGYSYAGTDEDKHITDAISSADNLQALLSFYEKFPELKERDLYISGESYAGIYVPWLAFRIHEHNQAGGKIPLKGIAVGNGATKWEYDTTPSYIPFAYMHNLMSKEQYDIFKEDGCEEYFRDVLPSTMTQRCKDMWAKFEKHTERLNWYDIYRDTYDGGLGKSRVGKAIVNGTERTYKRGFTQNQYTPWIKSEGQLLGDALSDYLNTEEVRIALHIPDEI